MEVGDLRTAIVHHWFLEPSGGERVCEELVGILGDPDFFALVCDSKKLTPNLKRCDVFTSFIQKLPNALNWYRYYALLYPFAVEQLDLDPYDLVISSDSSVVKGVLTRPETCHICYCHSPMRYAWNMSHAYASGIGRLKMLVFILTMHYLRFWDNVASSRVDYFIANSHNVRRRIWKYYRRDAKVIFPPCDVDRFSISRKIDDYYLLVTRLVSYKRADLAVRAFSENGKKLVVVGSGPEERSLKSIAGKNIDFLGWLDDEAIPAVYAGCKALVFPGEEDFGIVPVEAQAAGRPVIAYRRGGALETIIPDKTGIFFEEQTVEALNAAVRAMELNLERFESQVIRAHAETFSSQVFRREMRSHIVRCLEDHKLAMEGHTPQRSPGISP